MPGNILVIDDEPSIAGVLAPVLRAKGFSVRCSRTALDGLRLAQEEQADVVLLDLGLPDADGKDIIPHLLKVGPLSIIVLSARHQEGEKVSALDRGADDYVNKPFDMEELMARIRAALRRLRSSAGGEPNFVSDALEIDFRQRVVRLLGEEVKLSPKEYDLLKILAEHAGQVVTHRRLLLAGWADPHADPQYLRSYIALLRSKLEVDPSEPNLVLTEPGVGYRLSASAKLWGD